MFVGTKKADRNTGSRLAVVVALCIAVPSVIALQGCQPAAAPTPTPGPTPAVVQTTQAGCPSSSPFIVVAPKKEANDKPCFLAPEIVQVKQGQQVLFVNASSEDMKFDLEIATANVFDEGYPFTVPAGGIVCRTVSASAPTGMYPFKLTPKPQDTCPGYPGPGMQVQ